MMHKSLLKFNEYDKYLAKTLKQTIQDITMQRLEKDRMISKQFSGNAEIGDLKRELMIVMEHFFWFK